jgi:hypothetical protein
MSFQLDHTIYSRATGDRIALDESRRAEALNDEKLKTAKIERASQYLGMATPDNWQSIRSQAINEGLGDESTIPMEYDENWINQTRNAFAGSNSNVPSAIQEYNFYKKLNPTDQEDYLKTKRANNPLNFGDYFGRVSPVTNQVEPIADINVKPDNMPELKGSQARATAAGKVAGEAEGNQIKKEIAAPQMSDLIIEAEKLLPASTSSWLGRREREIDAKLGRSSAASQADKQLNVIAAALTGNVPRFEGPQGVLDVELYKQAAGDIANIEIPYEDRLAALQTIKKLNAKYTQQGSQSAPNLDTPIPKPGAPIVNPSFNPESIQSPLEGAQPRRRKFNPATGRLE